MLENYYSNFVVECSEALANIESFDGQNNFILKEEGLDNWVKLTKVTNDILKNVYFVGNGASAMMAGHMAADAAKNGGMKSLFLAETALITAVSNDIDYEEIFAFTIQRFGVEGDMLIAISSSGNSENIVKAVKVAKEKKMKVVTLTGINDDNRIRKEGDINFYIPAKTYGIVEVCHQALLHCWLDKYLDSYKGGRI